MTQPRSGAGPGRDAKSGSDAPKPRVRPAQSAGPLVPGGRSGAGLIGTGPGKPSVDLRKSSSFWKGAWGPGRKGRRKKERKKGKDSSPPSKGLPRAGGGGDGRG